MQKGRSSIKVENYFLLQPDLYNNAERYNLRTSSKDILWDMTPHSLVESFRRYGGLP